MPLVSSQTHVKLIDNSPIFGLRKGRGEAWAGLNPLTPGQPQSRLGACLIHLGGLKGGRRSRVGGRAQQPQRGRGLQQAVCCAAAATPAPPRQIDMGVGVGPPARPTAYGQAWPPAHREPRPMAPHGAHSVAHRLAGGGGAE